MSFVLGASAYPFGTGMASSAALYINSTDPTNPPSILLSWLPYLPPSILLNTSSIPATSLMTPTT